MKKNLNKLATLALTGMMVAGMSFGAMAAVTGDVEIQKVLETDGKTYAPNTTFTLKVNAGTLETDSNGNVTGNAVYKYTKDGEVKEETISSYDLKNGTAEQAALIDVTGATYSAEGSGDGQGILTSSTNKVPIKVNVGKLLTDTTNKITTPGVYVFDVTEADVTYEGVVKGADAPTQLLVVVNYSSNKALKIESVLFAKDDGTKVESLTNYYGGGSGENDKLYNLTLEKKIEGLGANKSEKFDFSVAVKPTNNNGATANTLEKYSYYAVTASGEAETESGSITATAADAQELDSQSVGKLGNGEKICIHGLSVGDEVTITETLPDGSNYVATYTVDEQTVQNLNGITLSADTDVTVTNTKNEITVTGVAMNIAPYAAMVLGAGAFAGIFLGGKRRRAEDED